MLSLSTVQANVKLNEYNETPSLINFNKENATCSVRLIMASLPKIAQISNIVVAARSIKTQAF